MGNSNSQSSSRFTTSLLNGNHSKEIRSRKQVTKFANPENRVLPIASGAIQRLRSTDNGSILQSGGTISGRKSSIQASPPNEPEFIHLLQKKCQTAHKPSQNHQPHKTLYGHRKSHSDPDIIRMMCEKDSDDDDDEDDDIDDQFDQEGNNNSRSIIAVSPSKAKIKSRKKTRAPEPPHSNTLPRSYDRTQMTYSSDVQRKISFRKKNDYHDTPRRPLPPIPPEELPPPPPPPPPDYNNQESESRSIIKNQSKNYEKNRRKVDKWKFTKPVAETTGDENHRQRSKSLDRTEEQRFRECNGGVQKASIEKKNSLRNIHTDQTVEVVHNGNSKRSGMSANDLKDAIADAARKRAERLERSKMQAQTSYPVKAESIITHSKTMQQLNKDRSNYQVNDHVRQYYFADRPALKHPPSSVYVNANAHDHFNNKKFDEKVKNHDHRKTPALHAGSGNCGGKANEDPSGDRIPVFKGHGHRREPSTSTPKQRKWDLMLNEPVRRFLPDGTPSSCSSSEEEMEIDLQLRPTLPRRPIELPRFSPTDVWKSINLDFFKSHQQRSDVSSDDGDEVLEDKIHRINRPVAPRRLINDRSADSGISPDAGSPMPHIDGFEILLTNNAASPLNRPITPQMNEEISPTWVPQHDLADDSDSVSEHLPVQTTPERISRPDSQAKFAMPNFMFPSRSLPRTEQQSNVFEAEVCVSDKERTRSRGRRKKSYKNAEGQHFNSLRNLKKALGLRTKSPIVAETPSLDANWSLSRSLPNFIDNLNADTVKRKVDNNNYTVSDAIKRSNSESRAFQQNNNDNSNVNNVLSQQSEMNSNMVWDNSFNNQTPDGHVIYLPEYSSSSRKNKLQGADDADMNTDSELIVKKSSNRKKFSYQSTVRQEEKKKLEEQLAREVEARERQRQKEIEWMNKVEDEFRKQRDKEKINIRHQLRILNLQEKSSNQRPQCESFINTEEIGKLPRDSQHINGNHPNSTLNGNQEPREMGYNGHKPTGMRKWLKRQNKYSANNGLCAIRPEPEGGRSSSDDCRQLDWKHDGDSRIGRSTENAEINSKCSHLKEVSCGRCVNGTSSSTNAENSDRPKFSSSLELMTPVRSSSMPGKKVERQRSNKEKLHQDSTNVAENNNFNNDSEISALDEDYRFIRESVEEYELHTRLCRTNSGRTFESHSYYALERRKNDSVDPAPEGSNSFNKSADARPKQNIFSSLNFETELKENVRKKTREFEKRTRKHQSRDFESDDSGSDVSDLRHQQRHGTRGQRKKKDGSEPREPSFSRNHPHRSAARKLSQVNGHHHLNGKLLGFQKSSNNDNLLPHHRIPSSVLG